jgi:DNA-binding response OmpR family regulator
MRILLVEDEPGIVRFVAKGLREQTYAVDAAATGADALWQISMNNYDAVILDLMIPAPDGFAVCKEIRARGIATPILILTARDATEDKIKGLDFGADDYLTKPFEFGELLARLRALLRRGTELKSAKIIIDDLEIDTVAQRVWRGDTIEIVLTAKEYALLEFLARRAGQIVTRAEIANHVWDENFDIFSNAIEVFINRLRRKIDTRGKPPLIHTKRGAGYVLSDFGAAKNV